jgi:fused signal recognition particle receptor
MFKSGFMGRLRERLSKTRSQFAARLRTLFGASSTLDEMLEGLEELLIEGDVGVETAGELCRFLREEARQRGEYDPEVLYGVLKEHLASLLDGTVAPLSWDAATKPHVTLVAGVNGAGKTTTIGKLAAKLRGEGRSVLLAAGDTFRAAAADQLQIWSERTGAALVRHAEGADPASVAFEAVDKGESGGYDNVIIDTAGRLHTKVNLMEEMKKVQRVIARRMPGAPHETLLVLDATTGQNGLIQAREFTNALNVSGIIITKLDGTAKGGIAIAIRKELGIPIRMIGVGEGVDDLQPFNAQEFVEALFE